MNDDGMAEYWADVKKAGQIKRAKNRDTSTQLLKEAQIQFEVKNLGAHLIITHKDLVADFWPGTGLWQIRGTTKQARGVRKLIEALNDAT